MACFLPFIVLAAGIRGYRTNTTPSEPLGLWRIASLTRSPQIGDRVFVCLPPDDVALAAIERGYLRFGLCEGWSAPLIKTVMALRGNEVAIGRHVTIDGAILPHSKVQAYDGKGRRMLPHSGGIIPENHVFLHSPFVGSYDSRYFGPVPTSQIIGLAEEVFTYAP